MLVLSRKKDESVRIGDNIEVFVLEIKHGKVRLGFRCPDDVEILRSEVHARNETALPEVVLSAVEHCQAG